MAKVDGQGRPVRGRNREADKLFQDWGWAMYKFEELCSRYAIEDVWIRGFSVSLFREESNEHLVTLRATTPTGKVVAFHGAATLAEALVGLVNRLDNRSLKWREDTWSQTSS